MGYQLFLTDTLVIAPVEIGVFKETCCFHFLCHVKTDRIYYHFASFAQKDIKESWHTLVHLASSRALCAMLCISGSLGLPNESQSCLTSLQYIGQPLGRLIMVPNNQQKLTQS